MAYLVIDLSTSSRRTMFVAASPGWALCKEDMRVYRDGTNPHTSGPEMTFKKEEAYKFKTHRSAARVANTLIKGIIQEID